MPNRKKKILILYGSVGLGHKVAAENIAQALRKYSEELEIQMLDVYELYKGALIHKSIQIYQWIIKNFPSLWGFFYTNRLLHKLILPLRIPFAAMKASKLRDFLAREQPDLILTTHPSSTALVAYLKKTGEYQGFLVTTFSDFHFQPFWVYPGADHYLVMTQEQKAEVSKLGFFPEQVTITGLSVHSAFLQDFSFFRILHEFGLVKTKPIILVMGGSQGWGIKKSDILALLSSTLDIQIAVLVGLNQTLYHELCQLAERYSENLKILGNLTQEEVAKFFSVAKILVTKPGGLTIAQAITKGLPMVLVNPLPAMEELNQKYLLSRGAALAARNPAELRAWVERLLVDKKFYQEIKSNIQRLASHPPAAQKAALAIVDIL